MDRRHVGAVVLTLLIAIFIPVYWIGEPGRMAAAEERQHEQMIERGAEIFVNTCVTCHGDRGQGGLTNPPGRQGLPLNTPGFMQARDITYLRKRVSVGSLVPPTPTPAPGAKPSTQTLMPAWSQEFGGPLKPLDIEYVVQFVASQRWDLSAEIFAKENAGKPTPTPAAAALGANATPADRGKALFLSKGCVGCHTIEGLSSGTVGPNLTHIATQKYDDMDNSPDFLKKWVKDPPAVKPGTAMPNLGLTDAEVDDVVAFLETLK